MHDPPVVLTPAHTRVWKCIRSYTKLFFNTCTILFTTAPISAETAGSIKVLIHFYRVIRSFWKKVTKSMDQFMGKYVCVITIQNHMHIVYKFTYMLSGSLELTALTLVTTTEL